MDTRISVEIVDDRAPEVVALTPLLEKKGFKVIQAFDSEEAINIAKKDKPDIMLLEIQLDCLNGYDVARLLPNQRILFMTQLEVQESEVKRFKNVLGLIKKPIDIDELSKKINTLAKKSIDSN